MISEKEIPTLYLKLKSHIARDFRPSATVTQVISGPGGGATSFAQLAGTIANSQAPQFLLRDGSRSLTGNLLVDAGITIDGVDISAHASNPDAHHARSHNILSTSDHTVTGGAALDVIGLSAPGTLARLTPSSAPGAAASLLASSAAGELVLHAFISTIGGVAGGAIMQGIVDVDTSYARAFFGHNAQWNGTSNLWTMDAIGANDASGLLLRNGADAIDFIFHSSTGNTSRTMDHATFTGGAKFTMSSAGRLGILNSAPAHELDVAGTMRATGVIYAGSDVEMTGELLAANGTVGAPSIAALADTDTGFYWPAADTLAVSAGGTAILTVGITGAAIGTALDTGATLKVQSIANGDITLFLKQRTGQTARMLRAENSTGQELIVLDAVGNLQSGNPGFVSGLTGWQIAPEGNAEFNNATIRGSLHSSIFVMDEFHASSGTTVFATAGRLLFDSSVGTGDVVLDIEDPVAGHARIFQVGNRLRAKGTGSIAASAAARLFGSLPGMIEFSVASNQGIHIMDVWLQVTAIADMTTHWRYTCTLLAGGRGTLPAGTAVIRWGNAGDGLVLATSDLNHAPYIDVFTSGAEPWAGDIQPHVRMGRLTGVGVLSPAHVWGIAGGNNLADATQPYFVASNAGIELYKSSLTLHDGTNPTVQMLPSGDVKFGRDIQVPSLTGFRFEPETGNVYIGNWPNGQYLAWSQGLGTLELKGSLVVERPSVVLWSDIAGRPADDAIYNSFVTWAQLSGVPEGLSGDYRDILSVSMPEVTNVTATSLTIPAGTVVKFRGGTYATKTLNSALIWTSFEAVIVYVYCKSANVNDSRILLTSTLSDLSINDVLLGRAIGGASKVTWQPLWGRVYIGDNSIVAGAVLADKIAAGAVTADKIAANAIIAAKIAAGAVTADKLSVTALSAVTADTGALNVTGALAFPAVSVGAVDYLRFNNGGSQYGYIGMKITLGPTPQADDGMIFHNANSTKFRFTGATQAIFEQSVTATVYYTSSDARLKTNLSPMSDALADIDSITPYRYQMIDQPGRWRLGVVAQDVLTVYPEAVAENDGYYTVDYGALVPVLLAAVRELKSEVINLKAKNR